MRDEWKETDTPMTQKRRGHSCLMLSEYELMVLGGYGGRTLDGRKRTEFLNSSEIFNLKEKTWNQGPDLETPLTNAQFLKAKPGSKYLAYVIGGYGDGGHSSAIFGLSQDKNEFKKIGDLKIPRSHHVAFVLPEGIRDKCGD